MLTLSRKPGEKITLIDSRTGEQVAELSIFSLHRSRVRIGFDAPGHISIARNEVLRESGVQDGLGT